MRRIRWRWGWLACFLVACGASATSAGSGDGGGTESGSVDASTDTSQDVTLDTGSESSVDVVTDGVAAPRHGSVQKGPFIHGSSITIQELDSTLQPTGQSFTVQTTDDLGSFDIPSAVSSRYVEIDATGYYFDEISNALSPSTLTLRSISDVSSGAPVHVNILTSLEVDRIRQLQASGVTFAAARAQTEPQVLSLLGIQAMATTTFDHLDESQQGQSNAILLAASVLLEQAGYLTSPSSPVAGLSELIATLDADLTGDAGLPAATAALLSCGARVSLNATAAVANLEARFASLGLDAGVPDFANLLPVPAGCEPADADCTGDAGAGVDGGPVPIVSGLYAPDHLVLDSTYFYWTSNAGVSRIPKGGGCVQLVASTPNAWGMAVGPSNVYWTTQNSGTVMSVPIAGGSPSTLWSAPAPGVYTDGIAVDSANVYWSAIWPNNQGVILEEPKGGGAVSVLASGLINPFDVTVDSKSVYWTEQGPNNPQTTNGMTLSALLSGATPLPEGGVDAGDAAVGAYDGGGPVTVLASGQYLPMWIAVDSANVYWTTWGDQQPGHGTVMQAPLAGPDAGTPIILATDHRPSALAVDTGFVYWETNTDPGTVTKVPIGGGTPVTLATGQHTPQSLALDSTNVYWTTAGTPAGNYNDGAIMKVAK
jgi:hypothetical protein